jgi:putative ABC transport system permease protein
MPWYGKWRNVFRDEALSTELDAELAYHLAETADRLIEQGVPPAQALRAARRRLGNYTIQKERTRDMNLAIWLSQLRADAVYGIRQLKRSPGFTVVAVLSLGLAIGANTAIFQLVNAVRLKLLPVKDPQQLVVVDWKKDSSRAGSWSTRSANFTYTQWEVLRAQQQAFSDMLAWSVSPFDLTRGGEPRFAQGMFVSASFFPVLGVGTELGRTLSPADDGASCNVGAVISDAFWQREFGGDPHILGRQLSLNGYPVSVIGVTPPSFFGVEVGHRYDVAIPLCADRLMSEDHKGRMPGRAAWWLSIMGRLKPGWTVTSASAYLTAISPTVMRTTLPEDYKPDLAKRYLANKLNATEANNGVSDIREDSERSLNLLLAITGLVLLIACANLANLLLARATVREPEIAVRLAMGASRWRVVRQLLVESLLLAVSGAALGVFIAYALSLGLIALLQSPDTPTFLSLSWDWRVLAFTCALALGTCLLFGLVPALRSTLLSPAAAMRASGRTATASRERFGLRRALVAGQVALSLLLLFGALLFVRSFQNLLTTDAGFKPEDVLGVGIDFSKASYPEAQRLNVCRNLTERLSAIPGVISAAQVGFAPVSGAGWDNSIGPEGAPAAASNKQAWLNRAGPGYFKTMGIGLLAGREFNDQDRANSAKVAIVNEEFARKYFHGVNPVGHTFHLEQGTGKPEPLFQIVGFVRNTKYYDLKEDFKPLGFFPVAQDDHPGSGMNAVLRIAGLPGPMISRAKAAIAEVGSSLSVQVKPMSEQLSDSMRGDRAMAILSGAFGSLAGLLATLGLYGVMSYMIARRRKEIGIRMALGADRRRVVQLVLKEALLLVAVGLAMGVGLSLWAAQAAEKLLFGVQPRDAMSLGGAVILLSAIAMLAGYIPAHRAAANDPASAVRVE